MLEVTASKKSDGIPPPAASALVRATALTEPVWGPSETARSIGGSLFKTGSNFQVADADPCFWSEYLVARHYFHMAVAARGGQLEVLKLGAKGPNGEPLSIDIGWFGAKYPKRVLVHSSGLHGVEAYAGSAIQLQWLREGLPSTPADSAIALVHILNPYGMTWGRRFNENNVDLNRNFRDLNDRLPDEPAHWAEVNALLNPPSSPNVDGFYLRAALLVLRYGLPSLMQAVAGGQSLNERGLFFIGRALEEGPAKFQEFLKRRLADVERIVAIDVHTGLGHFGADRLLVDSRIEGKDILRTMHEVFGTRIRGLSHNQIAYSAKGAQEEMYLRSFPHAKVYFATQEFGTYHPLRVVEALRAENRFHHYGRGAARHPAKTRLLEMFCPRDLKWRLRVLKRGEEVIRQACELAFRD